MTIALKDILLRLAGNACDFFELVKLILHELSKLSDHLYLARCLPTYVMLLSISISDTQSLWGYILFDK